ncbi:MAG: capsule assembly Wzi family protein [Muribaculaceae bacterium]|nr:capsule assembly Wzi family protein [Muribaculaceae bacterium]
MKSTLKSAIIRLAFASLLFISGWADASADIQVEYQASVTGQASTGQLAPYMLGSWNQGKYTEGNGLWQEAGLIKRLDMNRRFDWSAGFDYIAGIGEKSEYARWDGKTETWGESSLRRNAFRVQQLFGEIKYRAVYLTLGMKEQHSLIVDDRLSSGDLTRSNNATPIPGIGAGFIDFVDIPFTKGWLQINGEIMYGRMMDSRFKEREFNHYEGVFSQHLWYNYKRCYFRTNPDKNLYITIGMQAAGMFGGWDAKYKAGVIVRTEKRGFKLADVFQMFFPREGGENYYTGNHIGTWDFKADYKLRDGSRLSAYFEWPWEDGSGIGRMNGWDGLWGLQFTSGRQGAVNKVVVEYLDFTNQSGPIHYDPEDNPFNPLTGHAQGADDYYNNDYYGAYTNYGMSIGTPFLMSPIYNHNGSLAYLHNRARGFHAAIEGSPTSWLDYRVMAGYQKAGGSGRLPDYTRKSTVSAMLDVTTRPFRNTPQLELGLKMAMDKGELRGDNFGAQLQITYRGLFRTGK